MESYSNVSIDTIGEIKAQKLMNPENQINLIESMRCSECGVNLTSVANKLVEIHTTLQYL